RRAQLADLARRPRHLPRARGRGLPRDAPRPRRGSRQPGLAEAHQPVPRGRGRLRRRGLGDPARLVPARDPCRDAHWEGRGRSMSTPAPLELPRLGFGAAQLGNLYRVTTDEEAAGAVNAAWEGGIRYFDTAPHYGVGTSERRLGALLADKPRDEYVLSTKVGRLLRPGPGTGDDMASGFAVPDDVVREWDYSEAGVRRSHQ